MSYTPCLFNGKHAQVDGTSYACVVAIALLEAARFAGTEQRRRIWTGKLKFLQEHVHNYGTDIIGTTFDRIVGIDEKDDFRRALHSALKRIRSFQGPIPSAYLKEVIGQDDRIGYLQGGDEDPEPYVRTIRTLLKLLDGIESF